MKQEKNARMTIDRDFVLSDIDPRIYGSFVEHLGRAVYGGIYEPGHPMADARGFRTDVLEAARELGPPIVRYPGGNFVSGYNWEDGVGPLEERPSRLDLAWRVTETNRFGTDEFVQWAAAAGTQPMLAVNLGTRGADAARSLVEYCNHPSGTYYSDLRRKNGYERPHGVKVWGLGNEMDGAWQIGTKTATEYGRLACETAKLMKRVDPSIELVACGTSGSSTTMPSFGRWEAEVLEHCYEQVDYISLHQYFNNFEDDLPNYLAKSLDMDSYIRQVVATCDYVAAVKRIRRPMYLSFDEWNIWYMPETPDRPTTPWPEVYPCLEDIFSGEDTLLFGCMLITLLRHADRVKIACLSQLVNVLGPIRTQTGGGMYRQSIFYPYLHALRHGRGKVMRGALECPKYDSKDFCDVPFVENITVYNVEMGELVVFAVNRGRDDLPVALAARGFEGLRPIEHLTMDCSDIKAKNTIEAPDRIQPVPAPLPRCSGQGAEFTLPPLSWNMIRIGVAD